MSTEKRNKKEIFLSLYLDQSGVTAIIVGLCMVVLIGITAMALDIGHLYVVRGELQNAADATALAAAAHVYPRAPSAAPASPNWAAARAAAHTDIALNKSGGTSLADCTAATGYWNLSQTSTVLEGRGITPGPLDVPAVQVTVHKSPGNNGGPVQHWFASFIGVPSSNVRAQATAVLMSPGSVGPGSLFPMAIAKLLADQARSHDSPATAIRIGSSYHYPASQAGQWTSFADNSSSTFFMRGLIDNGNPTSLSVGDDINLQSGTRTALYGYVPAPSDVLLAVVDTTILNNNMTVPIYGFIGFHITASVAQPRQRGRAADNYVEGYFLGTFFTGLGSSSGPQYGAYIPPKLVQ